MPRWGLNHALHHAPYCFYLANSRLSSRAPSWRGGGQSRHCVRNTSAGTGVTNAELCEAVANHREGLGRRSLWRRDQAVNVKVGGVPFRCRPMTPSALVKGKPPVAMSDNLTHGQAPIGCDRTTRRLERNRKFVDSPLEGNGFELSVPRCPADSVGAFIRRRVGSSSRRNCSIGFAEADHCSDDTAAPTVDRPQTRTKSRNRYLSRAELKVPIHSPPAKSQQQTRFRSPA
jgi:hypothetical protein